MGGLSRRPNPPPAGVDPYFVDNYLVGYGLDHLALAVAGVTELEQWRDWLSDQQVERSPTEETELSHHLNLRAPDNVAIELLALRPAMAIDLGLG